MNHEILTLEKAAMDRWRKGDPHGFIELSADDILYVDVGQTRPIQGLESFRAYMKQFEGNMFYQKSEFIAPRVVLAGNAALLTYNYRSTVFDGQGAVTAQTPWNATEVYFQ